ncbi:hypothetical protein TH66_05285 [Carbonactinospora thermoautotrophica]|uniref:Uncharacterized protein n=1 Tax=Carbonactinospora thermoautotrophica TaxID=1469144 RepID=A0A132N3I1_9ACTN|nr:hypothetical protein TH66_05285 [Carbonactinospora thermoautotrophica]
MVDIFPDRGLHRGLVGAVLAEQANEWTEARCYMSRGMLAKARIRAVIGESLAQPIAPEAIPA